MSSTVRPASVSRFTWPGAVGNGNMAGTAITTAPDARPAAVPGTESSTTMQSNVSTPSRSAAIR